MLLSRTTEDVRHSQPRSSLLPTFLAALSAVLYVSIVFSIGQNRAELFKIERGSIAAAVSNVAYGGRFGAAYSAVTTALVKTIDQPLQSSLDALPPNIDGSGAVTPAIVDGTGVGYVLVATVAIRLFGPHVWGLELLTVGLTVLSAIVFLWRFGSPYAGTVILYFVILVALQFSVYQGVAVIAPGQISLGGIRYFALVAFIPAFYLCLEFFDSRARGSRWDYLLLGAQATIFLIAALVRISAGCLVGAVIVAAVAFAWRYRRDAPCLRLLGRKGLAFLFGVALILTGIIAATPPAYLQQGRFNSVFWHRAVISLGANPAWPFMNLNSAIDCHRDIPDGLVRGIVDRNGHCIWVDYAIKHNLPDDVVASQIYGGFYGSVMRDTLFRIAGEYPREVLATFLYYKPKMLLNDLLSIGRLKFDQQQNLSILLLLCSVGIFVIYIIATPPPRSIARRMFGIAVAFSVCNLCPMMVAWPVYWTMDDFVLSLVFCAATILILAISTVRAAWAGKPAGVPLSR
jgi:hypothetical protein